MSTRMRNVVRYVVPSVGGMLSVFLYIVVDGIFVGRGVGIDALAAVNLASPYTILTGALVSLIAIDGSSVTAIRIGRGDDKGANDAFMTSVVMLIVFSALVTVIGTCFGNVVAKLSGTTPRLIEMTTEYLFYFSLFSSAQAISQLLCTFVRNDGSPRLAFWGMVCGAVSNIFLDWLFVFPLQMGIKGAAIASGLGQIISCLLVVSHFVFKRGKLRFRKLRLSAPLFRKVAMRGLPEFITQLFPTITILCYNHTIIRYFGETVGEFWVSAFSIVSYIASLSIAIFTGVGEGIQPLLGQSYGKKSKEDINYYFKAGLFINVGLSALLYLVFGYVNHVVV